MMSGSPQRSNNYSETPALDFAGFLELSSFNFLAGDGTPVYTSARLRCRDAGDGSGLKWYS